MTLHLPGILSVSPSVGTTLPLVFDSPHSGVVCPPDFHPAAGLEWILRASDLYVDDLFAFVPALGASLLVAHFPRSFMDVNRSLLDVDTALLDGPWPHAVRDSASARRGMGLVWRYAWGDIPMYDRAIGVSELERRIERYWRPYHRQLRELLDHAHATHGCVYHVNCHSMPAQGHALSPDPAGTRRPDFVIGDFDGTTCEPGFVKLLTSELRKLGYTVTVNDPFRGAELITAYSSPAQQRHSVQIEINRRLYMDEETRSRTPGYEVLREHLQRVAAALSTYVARKIASCEAGQND